MRLQLIHHPKLTRNLLLYLPYHRYLNTETFRECVHVIAPFFQPSALTSPGTSFLDPSRSLKTPKKYLEAQARSKAANATLSQHNCTERVRFSIFLDRIFCTLTHHQHPPTKKRKPAPVVPHAEIAQPCISCTRSTPPASASTR